VRHMGRSVCVRVYECVCLCSVGGAGGGARQ